MLKIVPYFYFVLLYATNLCAQNSTAPSPPVTSPDQCRIAFYTRDSIAIQFTEAKPKYESIQKSHDKLNSIREQLIPATDRYLTAKSDSAKSKTVEGKKEIQVSNSKILGLRNDSIVEEENIRHQYFQLSSTYKKIDAIADSIGKARGVKQTRESADNSAMICPTDQMLMIDITNDVALAMGVKPKLAKIGIYNMDSLLRLMPGYAIIGDSLRLEKEQLELELSRRYAPVTQKQRELDSLRPTLSKKQISKREEEILKLQDEFDTYRGTAVYNYYTRDSLIATPYKMKFYKALNEVHKSAGCQRSYEYADAHRLWDAKEAEFIDLNRAIATKLK